MNNEFLTKHKHQTSNKLCLLDMDYTNKKYIMGSKDAKEQNYKLDWIPNMK